jgi:hypothetical protein
MSPSSITSHAFKAAPVALAPALLREIFQATPLYIFGMAVLSAVAQKHRP